MDEVERIIKEAEKIPVIMVPNPSKGAALLGVLGPLGLALLFALGTTNWWTP